MNLTQTAEAKADKAEANEIKAYFSTDNAPRQRLTAEAVRAYTDFTLAKINQARIDIKDRINELRKEADALEKELERLNNIPEELEKLNNLSEA